MLRFSPSPTGKLHLGSVRTAVVSYILAKQSNSKFILRMEDTDKVRSQQRWADEIIQTLSALGVQHDGDIVYQSHRHNRYHEIAECLVKKGFAYYCSCSVEELKAMKRRQIMTKSRIGYEGTCRDKGNTSGVLRLNIPAIIRKKVHFNDGIFGSKTLDYREIPDAVLMRANGEATYLLANTVDDFDAGVTHIVRGADLLPQTFLQICLFKALKVCYNKGAVPEYTHLPLMLDENGEKISKRKEETKSILSYLEQGVFPDAIIQFVLSIGNKSIPTNSAFTLQEMIEMYDVTATSMKNTKYLEHKLWHINKLHLKRASAVEVRLLIHKQYHIDLPVGLVELLKVRYRDLKEIAEAGQKIVDMYLMFAEDKQYIPETLEEIKEYRRKVFQNEATPPLNELLPILHHELMAEERISYDKENRIEARYAV